MKIISFLNQKEDGEEGMMRLVELVKWFWGLIVEGNDWSVSLFELSKQLQFKKEDKALMKESWGGCSFSKLSFDKMRRKHSFSLKRRSSNIDKRFLN